MNKEVTLNELGEMLSHVVTHMATKEDLADLRTELKADIADLRSELGEVKIEMSGMKIDLSEVKSLAMATASELAIVRRDVEEIKETVESHKGFAKEIDHTLHRVVIIERHLGLATS